MPDLAAEIRAALTERADPERAPDMQRYMKSADAVPGRPEVPAHARGDAHGAGRGLEPRPAMLVAAAELWDGAIYREERYAALAVLRGRWLVTPRDEPFLRHLITTGAWWDLVDEIATKLVGPVRADLDMRTWAHDEDQWIRRAAILCQIGAKDATDPTCCARSLSRTPPTARSGSPRPSAGPCATTPTPIPQWVRGFRRPAMTWHRCPCREATKHL